MSSDHLRPYSGNAVTRHNPYGPLGYDDAPSSHASYGAPSLVAPDSSLSVGRHRSDRPTASELYRRDTPTGTYDKEMSTYRSRPSSPPKTGSYLRSSSPARTAKLSDYGSKYRNSSPPKTGFYFRSSSPVRTPKLSDYGNKFRSSSPVYGSSSSIRNYERKRSPALPSYPDTNPLSRPSFKIGDDHYDPKAVTTVYKRTSTWNEDIGGTTSKFSAYEPVSQYTEYGLKDSSKPSYSRRSSSPVYRYKSSSPGYSRRSPSPYKYKSRSPSYSYRSPSPSYSSSRRSRSRSRY